MEKYKALDCFDWSELPFPAIEKIYSFLNRRDQANMTLVCRNWRKEYSSPNLWRRLEFHYPLLESNKETYPEVIFAGRYGHMCHHVKICFNIFQDHFVDPFPWPSRTNLNKLKLFVEVLTRKSQLLSISFINMRDYLCFHDDVARADLYQAVQNLMRSQKKLRYVEFRNAILKKDEEAEILNIILENNYKTLKALHFYDSCDCHPGDEFTNFTVDGCLSFHLLMNLEILIMDYTEMFEKLMVAFYECRDTVKMRGKKGNLKHITLSYNYRFDLLGVVVPVVWEYFKNIFPNLTVDLIYKFTVSPNFYKIIVPQMPLRSLSLSLNYADEADEKIDLLLHHITSCGINKYLETLTIRENDSQNISPDLINFPDVCTELKLLDLSFKHPVTELETVFYCWIEMTSSKLIVKITVTNVKTEEEKIIYTDLYNFFAPLLQAVGIKLSIDAQINY